MNLNSVDELEQKFAGFSRFPDSIRAAFEKNCDWDAEGDFVGRLNAFFQKRGIRASVLPLGDGREVLCLSGWFEAYIVIPPEIRTARKFCAWARKQTDTILSKGKQKGSNWHYIGY